MDDYQIYIIRLLRTTVLLPIDIFVFPFQIILHVSQK